MVCNVVVDRLALPPIFLVGSLVAAVMMRELVSRIEIRSNLFCHSAFKALHGALL